MKPNNTTFWRLKWQIFAGYLFPILWGWFLFAWLAFLTEWIVSMPHVANQKWFWVVTYSSWFLLAPISGFSMGVLNFYCWRKQNWSNDALSNHTAIFLMLFWLVSFPLAIFLSQIGIGWVVLLLHVISFCVGQIKGKTWIETNALKQFLGRKNDWERDEAE